MSIKPMAWHEEAIATTHDWQSFNCGNGELNGFFVKYARQNHDKGVAKTYVAINDYDGKVMGYYTLSPASIAYNAAPQKLTQGLARHEIPVFRLARLAVDVNYQGVGLGGQLLLSAGKRCIFVASQAGGVAMLIDAKDEKAAKWYETFGAIRLLDKPNSLILPFSTIYQALNSVGKI
ncbi:GNAT family N-acetyltransferase [Caedibacter taeniospiralis]|uniref:GNAT family N-acetyltransferase n=1 Tax=Caedibacter taeniospiralis TaxID=28907 RepID=UPI000C26FED2|nr:GNAT family N-acetyltransferase [Caedibacter taeniospiralis]